MGHMPPPAPRPLPVMTRGGSVTISQQRMANVKSCSTFPITLLPIPILSFALGASLVSSVIVFGIFLGLALIGAVAGFLAPIEYKKEKAPSWMDALHAEFAEGKITREELEVRVERGLLDPPGGYNAPISPQEALSASLGPQTPPGFREPKFPGETRRMAGYLEYGEELKCAHCNAKNHLKRVDNEFPYPDLDYYRCGICSKVTNQKNATSSLVIDHPMGKGEQKVADDFLAPSARKLQEDTMAALTTSMSTPPMMIGSRNSNSSSSSKDNTLANALAKSVMDHSTLLDYSTESLKRYLAKRDSFCPTCETRLKFEEVHPSPWIVDNHTIHGIFWCTYCRSKVYKGYSKQELETPGVRR